MEESEYMKAIVKTHAGLGVKCIDTDRPLARENEVLIQVKAAAICGTDYHYYYWDKMAMEFAKNFKMKFPFIIGHECSGIIVDIGPNVKNRYIGQRVAIETHISCGMCFECQNNMIHNCNNLQIYGTSCNGCFAEYTTVNENATFVLPDEISYEMGALLEPAGVSMRAVEKSHILPGDIAIVNGCGPIGLIIIKILKIYGASKIIAIDKNDFRLQMAEKFGAISINLNDPNMMCKIEQLVKKRQGADVLFEASGSIEAYEYIFKITRKEGKIITIGHPETPVMIDIMKDINLKGIVLKGVFGRKIWNTWWNLSSLLINKRIDITDIVTHRFNLDDCQDAFLQRKGETGKVVFVL